MLNIYGCAIDTYKIIMNTNEYRDSIIESLIDTKKVSFIGSHMVFDPQNEDKLEEYYCIDGKSTTEGKRSKEIINTLANSIKKCRKKYICFTLGSIMKMNNVCHHVSFVLMKEGETLIIKMINSGLYYLSRSYEDVLIDIMKKIAKVLKMKPEFHHPYISHMWMGFSFNQKCNPQDYCRGGLIGEINTMIDKRAGIHRESYCQTWCILMLLFELKKMKRVKYNIRNNFLITWDTNKKILEIKLREFIIALVTKFEKKFDFLYEFDIQLKNNELKYNTSKFSNILLESFQNLHPEIKRKKIVI